MRPAPAVLSNSPKTLLLQSVRLLICLLCMNFAQPLAALAQTNTPVPLPPAAQEAYDKGIMAAREQGYLVAIRYLQEARKLAPQAPQIFRSMGAVEAKIPGRELRSMAWYGTYLAAVPNAPDAAEVRKEIIRLEVKSQISISVLIKQVQDAANNPGVSRIKMEDVASLWAEAGDIAAAIKAANQASFYKDSALSNIAEAQIKAGDITGALKTTDLISPRPSKYGVQSNIAKTQMKAGDITSAQKTFAEALKTVDLFSGDAFYLTDGRLSIAEAQIEAGDIAGAKKTLILAQNSVVLHNKAHRISELYSGIARVQARTGDIAGAQKTADPIQDTFYKGYALLVIAQAQAKNGDISGALKTANLIENLTEDASEARVAIARAQAMAGDISGAQKTADLIKQAYFKNIAQAAIAGTQKKAKPQIQPVMSASVWLKKLDDDNKSNDCPLNTEPFLDLASYLKSLPPSDVPQKVFDSLHEAARKVVRAQNIIQRMVKNEVKK